MSFIVCLTYVIVGLGYLGWFCVGLWFVIDLWLKYTPEKVNEVLAVIFFIVSVLFILGMLFVALPMTICSDSGGC